MARQVKPLSDAQIRNAKAKEKDYKLFDGDGLVLLIKKSGKKVFIVRFKLDGKESQKTLGQYPEVSLATAREQRAEIQNLLKSGVSPNTQVKKDSYDFDEVAELYFAFKSKDLSEDYIKKQKSRYRYYIQKGIGDKSANSITKLDIINLINNIPNVNTRSTKQTDLRETMRTVLMLVSSIFKYGNMNELMNNSCYLNIDKKSMIPQRKNEHFKAVTGEKEFLNIYKLLKEYQGDIITRYALIFLAHTALRSQNVRFLKWESVDFERRVVNFSASEMKSREEYRMPITCAMHNLLKEVYEFSKDHEYVFSSTLSKNKMLSENTLGYALKRMEIYDHSPHGFRSSFSTIVYENHKEHGFSSEVIEAQLSHTVGNKVKLAYLRSDFLEERRELLEWWDKFLMQLHRGSQPTS